MKLVGFLGVISAVLSVCSALWLDTNNDTTIFEATSLISSGLLDYYEGYKYGGTVGMFVWPYYWWEAGGAWGSLIDYTYYMENDTYVKLIKEALEYQTGEDYNYIPLNQSTTEGNDDQGFWGIAVMGATEKNFSNPSDPKKAWLSLAQAVFNTMTARWDEGSCNGGLRWQIFTWNSGYDYKNSVSNGCLFHIAARLARYTANDSYVDWAEKVWDWLVGTNILTEGDMYFVHDGASADDNCSEVVTYQWTYNQGLMLAGCAYLWNYTQDDIWLTRVNGLLKGASVFFHNDVMYEAACQPVNNCNEDQRSFKAYFSRFLGLTSVLVPETYDQIRTYLVASANGAAQSCSGGSDGHTCGLNWFNGSWDGMWGLGEQMCALEVMQNLRVAQLPGPYTAKDGGSSIANPASGYGSIQTAEPPLTLDAGDRAGAGIITAIIGVSVISAAVWLIL